MSLLREIESLGLRVGWRTALLGWDGPAACQRKVEGSELVELAVEALASSPELLGDTLELASLRGDETDEVDRLIRSLARDEDSSEPRELRKWRLLLLHKLLAELAGDPLRAWMELAEFWHTFGDPDDSPVIIRGFKSMNPEDRYTEVTRERLASEHREWLLREQSVLSNVSEELT